MARSPVTYVTCTHCTDGSRSRAHAVINGRAMDYNGSRHPKSLGKSKVFPRGFDLGFRKSPLSSASARFFPDDSSSARSPLSAAASTPVRFSLGVPFSWEKLPGVPKRPASGRRSDPSASFKHTKLLPLPPSATPKKHGGPAEGSTLRKKSSPPAAGWEWDPFVAALVECSRDDAHIHHHDSRREEEDDGDGWWVGAKVTRSISDRFDFARRLSSSCKSMCSVDESIVYVPRSSSAASATRYGLIRYDHPGSSHP
ncbi:hypothetical protein SAY86_019919 [Trapa natans]|uniref:Uncharacterized protein n=1 Tax=Trapa natans TaxID=22666 RepID=A0AAN7R542_TRANT|nr:hypothetical protein SAY86_019919 [Trapa natans]